MSRYKETGYGTPQNISFQQPHYVSERGNKPTAEQLEYPMNRRQRRAAGVMSRTAISETPLQVDAEVETTREVLLGNPDLPISEKRHEIVDAIRDNQVTVIVSETGSGKSTQVVQYILDDLDMNSTITQPRRIATRNIAERVEHEISSVKSELSGVVAQHTAEKDTRTDNTRITVCTDGLRFVKQLHDDGKLTNEVLVIDEIHEWNTNQEMLVGWTRELLKENPQMRVVIMSATMDANEISNFYADVTDTVPPIVEVEGRTYNVEKFEKPDSTVVEELVSEELLGKNVLCFLPGKGEIKDAITAVRKTLRQRGMKEEDMPALVPLHSKLSEREQDKAFRSYPNGKIVFSTNVAQTSLTIPDIDAVVDSGLERQKQIDDEGSESLPLVSTSQDDCDQRAGRAGRVKEGIYILTKLGKGSKFESYISRSKHSEPEIRRTDVDKNVLHFAAIGLDLENIKIPHSIKLEVVQRSKRALHLLGALDDESKITALGRRMEAMPLHPVYARMILESEQYSQATHAQAIALAAASDIGGLKYYAPDSKKRWKELSDEEESDLLAQLEIFIAARHMTPRQLQEHDLDVKNVSRSIEQYEKIARRMSIDPDILSNPNAKERENLKRCIYAGMIDHIYEHTGSGEYMRINGQVKTPREISNRSVVRGRPGLLAGTPYRVEYFKNGDIEEKHIMENVTKVAAPEVLAEIALHLCSWTTESRTLRGGQLQDVQSLSFRGVPMGVVHEVPAQSGIEAHEFMVKHVMEHPGSALRELYAVEARIKTLRKLSPHAPKSIHATIRQVVETAVTQSNLDETYVDQLIRERNISLRDYVGEEAEAAIVASSPDRITQYGFELKISYEAGKPLIKRYDLEAAAQLPGEVVLQDGRVVEFVGEHGRRYKVAELRAGRHLK